MSDTGFFISFFMQVIFDDNGLHKSLAPFTLTRPVAEIRFGIMTIRESWAYYFDLHGVDYETAYLTKDYLNAKFKKGNLEDDSLIIAGNYKATPSLVKEVLALKKGEGLFVNGVRLAQKGQTVETEINTTAEDLLSIEKSWHIFQRNDKAVESDFEILTSNKTSQVLSETNRSNNPENIFIAEGAKVEHAILNASTGPIYIGKDAEVMEGAMIRGPFALCEKAVVKMGAKIYGATTIGPECKVGGEVSNCVFQSYSNKGHDGFLGNSVIGEWCNLGADNQLK